MVNRGKKLNKRGGGRHPGGRTFSAFNDTEDSSVVSVVEENQEYRQRNREMPPSSSSSDNEEERDQDSDHEDGGNSTRQQSSTSNAPSKRNIKLSDLNNIVNNSTNDSSLSDEPMNRREREALQKQKAKEAYFKATMEGKTEQARADLARLAIIRQQREEAARKRTEEQAAKKGQSAKTASLNAGKALLTKTLGK